MNSNAIKSGFNWSHYNNPHVDSMIAKANFTADDAKRNAIYEQVCMQLRKDAMYLPMWDVNGPFTMTPAVKGVHTTLNGYLMFHSAPDVLAYILRRLAAAVPVVIGITIVAFLLIHLVPGDPAKSTCCWRCRCC